MFTNGLFSTTSHQENAMTNRNRFNDFDTSNPAPRCPVILLLDVSGSMSGDPISELNAGLRQFIHETAHDEVASMSVELEVITFSDGADAVIPFTPILDINENFSPLVADGMTSLGAALTLAYDHLQARRKVYRQNGIASYKPWVILMTDGGPNDDWQGPAQRMRDFADKRRITYLGIEIGDDCEHDTMCRILPSDPGPVKLKGLHFRQFFRWLTDSLNTVSTSSVAQEERVVLPNAEAWVDGLDNM
ncbi:MAG: VWA domain-containing protein [Oligosphaeraceae bacterium]